MLLTPVFANLQAIGRMLHPRIARHASNHHRKYHSLHCSFLHFVTILGGDYDVLGRKKKV
jgi:hypothetical protein